MNNQLQHGDIFMAKLEDKNLTVGEHPVLVLTSKNSLADNNLITIVPLSSKYKKGYYNFFLENNAYNGLDLPSYAICNQVRTISKRDLLQKIGFIQPAIIDEILIMINKNFGIEITIQK